MHDTRKLLLQRHYQYPLYAIPLSEKDFSYELINYACGDRVDIACKIVKNVIVAIMIKGKGCVLSVAASSILAEMIVQQSLEAIQNITEEVFLKHMGMDDIGPVRAKCLLLPLYGLKKGIAEYHGQKAETIGADR